MTEEPPGERPKWSVTWLFRVQRIGRNRLPPQPGSPGDPPRGLARLFPWAVLLLLLVEVGILVWIGVLPR